MPETTIGFGISLIIQGFAAYFGTGQVSKTALIPTIPGGLLALLGFAGQRESLRRWTMHGALLVALLGLVGAFMGRRPGADPKAKAARALMASTCATYLALSTRSYLVGRCAGARHESQAQVDA